MGLQHCLFVDLCLLCGCVFFFVFRQAAAKEKELASGGPCRISIHNLPFTITSEQLKELFNEFAKASNLEVKDGAVIPDPQGRGSSGTCVRGI